MRTRSNLLIGNGPWKTEIGFSPSDQIRSVSLSTPLLGQGIQLPFPEGGSSHAISASASALPHAQPSQLGNRTNPGNIRFEYMTGLNQNPPSPW